ncbi:MAG: helix-turn-helix transcriptional regulator [Rothia sp. (in: high G+C Gram-positive bacteria)]|nr:helix-turn-helix transcriptional regulator [Rothia sp. (in: high G+C Gram-positive bacteria)]
MEIPVWTLADRITKARNHAGLSQAELAEKLPAARNTLSRWERGDMNPSRRSLEAISKATGVSFEWLVHGEPASAPTAPQRFIVEVSGNTLTASPLAD